MISKEHTKTNKTNIRDIKDELGKTILKNVLLNAIKYKGKANQSAVISKLFSEVHGLKDNKDKKDSFRELAKKVAAVIKEVNALGPEDQIAELERIAPGTLEALTEMKEKEKKKEDILFDFLGIQSGESVITAFPPGPEKYPHLGHAKALIINHELARKYKGKFILRFEDTNPKLVKKKFYDIMLQDFAWLNVKWDELIYASDFMELYYSKAEELIKTGNAYVCNCSKEDIRESRAKGIACKCRSRTDELDENMRLWKEMLSTTSTSPNIHEGAAVLRLKIDLEHQNSTMRDPAIFRIIEHEHARHGNKYRVWPSYDFQSSIMDGQSGITHRIRSKEFEMRNELQRYIQKLLGYKETKIYEMARFNIEGVPSSGRIIRGMIDEKKLIGWDDPSLTTIAALRRRGFLPEALTIFLLSTGITKHESLLGWDDIAVHNRRILDPKCNRYFFIKEPVHIRIKEAPSISARLHLHPDFKDRGERIFSAHEEFIISPEDFEALKEGELYRLMDCLNFKKAHDAETHNPFIFVSKEYSDFKDRGNKIMHWLPYDNENKKKLVHSSILMPDKTIVKGLAEEGIAGLNAGDIIQFERFGFCRLDEIKNAESNELHNESQKKFVFWFTHK